MPSDAKDILLIFVGQAGINVAERFWKYAYESLGLHYPEVFYQQAEDRKLTDTLNITEFYKPEEIEEARRMFFYTPDEEGEAKRFIPRAIFLDVEAQPARSLHARNTHVFPERAFIYSTFGSGSTFARAHRMGNNLKPRIEERILHLIKTKAIVNLEGIVVVHATGGGAGSGLLNSLFDVLKTKFYKVPILTFTVYPSTSLSANVIEAYNTVYALNSILISAGGAILVDNEKIIQMIKDKYEIASPSFEDINLILSRLLFSILMQFAMPGSIIRIDYGKIFTNLIPYKYMKFMMPALAPFRFDEFSRNLTKEVVEDITNDENYMVECDLTAGKFTSAMFMFMGKVGPEVQGFIREQKEKMNFVDWMPTGTTVGITPREKMTLDGIPIHRQGVALANHSSIAQAFKRILRQYKLMKDKGAFLNHFLREHIDSVEELEQAEQNVSRMIKFFEIAEKSGKKKQKTVAAAPTQ